MATKIVDLIKAKEAAKEPFIAFEYYPPRTDAGLEKLYERVQRMKLQGTQMHQVRKTCVDNTCALRPTLQSQCTWMSHGGPVALLLI